MCFNVRVPPQNTEHRKLAAIMFTDMVGYSATSQRNEALALELLAENQRLLRTHFPLFNGREVKTTGDGFLVEFPSALQASQCAVEIQRAMASRNATNSGERQIHIRIGIHVGDVVVREGDIYGDGVNIAARIEPLAIGGGICLSETVYAQVRNKLDVGLAKHDSPKLKHIEVPMDVYRVILPWQQAASALPNPAVIPPSKHRSRAAALGLILALGLGLGALSRWLFDHPSPTMKTVTDQAKNIQSPIGLPSTVRSLPAGNVLKLLYSDPLPTFVRSGSPLSLQFQVKAKRFGETHASPLANGDRLASGVDGYYILARASSSGFLYVFQVDSSGKTQWLFPQNKCGYSSGSNPLASEQTVRIPPTGGGLLPDRNLMLDNTTGIEHIYFVFSVAAWPELESVLSQPKPPSFDGGTSVARVEEPNNLGMRGVGGVIPAGDDGENRDTLPSDLTIDGTTNPLVISGETFKVSEGVCVMERWFKHVN
jgi:class 3 adenylate cyclase